MLADFLLSKNYKVAGLKRRSSTFNTQRIDHLYKDFQSPNNFKPFYGDLTDSSNLIRVIKGFNPDEIYNLGAQSHVHTSFETPEYTANTDALGTLRVLEAIRILKLNKKVKFYQASTSEILVIQKHLKTKIRLSKPESPYEQQNFMHIGLQKIIEKLITYLHVMEFYLIMKVRGVVRHLLLEKLLEL